MVRVRGALPPFPTPTKPTISHPILRIGQFMRPPRVQLLLSKTHTLKGLRTSVSGESGRIRGNSKWGACSPPSSYNLVTNGYDSSCFAPSSYTCALDSHGRGPRFDPLCVQHFSLTINDLMDPFPRVCPERLRAQWGPFTTVAKNRSPPTRSRRHSRNLADPLRRHPFRQRRNRTGEFAPCGGASRLQVVKHCVSS
jgi:hypothetical protein